jgi:hypothetical protein
MDDELNDAVAGDDFGKKIPDLDDTDLNLDGEEPVIPDEDLLDDDNPYVGSEDE